MIPSALVTGGAGFIGSHVVDRLLDSGWRVTVMDDLSTGRTSNLTDAEALHGRRLELVGADLTTADLDPVLDLCSPEVVIHLAAQINVRASVDDPVRDALVNVIGTVRLLEAVRRHGVQKVVFATSGGCIYGDVDEADLPVAETYVGSATSPYGASKRCGEEYLRTFEALYGLHWIGLALSNVYGPRQDPLGEAGVVSIFCEQMLNGDAVTIFGDGDQTRDFVYVEDVADAFVTAATSRSSGRFNIGNGQRTSVNCLFATLRELIAYTDEPRYQPERQGELRHSGLDIRRAADDLPWVPTTPLDDGLAATLTWSRNQPCARHVVA